MRYDNNIVKKSTSGKLVFQSRIMPNIPLRSTDMYVMSETGDRLDTLAYEYYKDQSLWWIIAASNNIHDAPIGLKEGTILRIPMNFLEIQQQFSV